MSAFEEMGVCPELIRSADEAGWLLPTPVQAEAVPLILGGGDVLAAAETGSGKTGAFGMPVLQIVHEALRDAAATHARGKDARADGPDGGSCSGADAGASAVRVSVDDRTSLFAVDNAHHSLPKGVALVQARSHAQWAGARATVGVVQGAHHYEVVVRDDGLVRCGWSTTAGSLDGLGTDSHGFGFGGTGKKSHAKAFTEYGRPYGDGDVLGVSVDRDAELISYQINGEDFGAAFEIPKRLKRQALFPALCLKNAECSVNFGAAPWRFEPPPGGYKGVACAGPGEFRVGSSNSDSAVTTEDKDKTDKRVRTPKAIVLEPARDLAEQTHEFFRSFSRHLGEPAIQCGLFVGGTDVSKDVKALKAGCDVATGTPGRIIDMVESGRLDVSGVRFFVLDEADRLLDSGNRDAILKLFDKMPKSGRGFNRLQVLLFSATLHSNDIGELSQRLCEQPTWVDLKGKDAVPDTVHHACVFVDPDQDEGSAPDASGKDSGKDAYPNPPTDNAHKHDDVTDTRSKASRSQAIKQRKPHVLKRLIDAHAMSQCLIFCRTNFDCDNVETFLNQCGGGGKFRGKAESGPENPYSCVVLGGSRSMDERRRNLAAFKEGDVRFLICTDVAARGLDVKGLPFVINVTLPDKSEDYVHRIGRVGRADTMGLAISIVAACQERVWYCQKKGHKPWFDPSPQDSAQHCVWYDEPKLLKDIEARIKTPVARIDPATLALPKELLDKLGHGKTGGAGDAASIGAYGKSRGNREVNSEISAHLEAYAPSVKRLAELEVQAQASFWRLKQKFARR